MKKIPTEHLRKVLQTLLEVVVKGGVRVKKRLTCTDGLLMKAEDEGVIFQSPLGGAPPTGLLDPPTHTPQNSHVFLPSNIYCPAPPRC